jgi:hypothetical protein
MTVYVDQLVDYPGKGKWCHMATDGDLEELLRFAESIGLWRSWCQQHDKLVHYDLTPGKRAQAIQAGAAEVSAVELWARCRKEG